ncbi:MAG TPA: bacterial Ig-like domain-containing protein [Firmicutes bacterium]|nr:bacterial Ig-like domain-containing protein [Bacillota bacterium]
MKKFWSGIAVSVSLALAAVFFAACGQTTVPDGETPPSVTPPGTDEYYVTELEVQTPPDKTEYFVGEEFDYTGMVLYAEWNDGETEEIGAYECDEIRPSGPLTASDTTITFVYYGAETTFDITVSEQTINSLDVDSSAVEKRVVAGQNVNLTSIVVTASYGDGETMPVTKYTLTENGEEIETPSRYVVTEGTHTITVSYLNLTAQFEVVGFSGVKYDFGADSIKSDVTETTAEMPLFVEPANTVKTYTYTTVDGERIWSETTTAGYKSTNSEGLTDIKALAEIKIHFRSETASWANINMNAASYYIYQPASGQIRPMELPKLFSSVSLNGEEVKIAESVLPGGTGWQRVFADVLLCSGNLKEGDNTLTLVVDDMYYNSKYPDTAPGEGTENSGNQLYMEAEFSIASMTVEYGEEPRVVTSLEITKQPDKTAYKQGDTFVPTGMEVTAHYNKEPLEEIVTDYTYDTEPLDASDTYVTISYGGASATVPITVEHTHVARAGYEYDKNNHWQTCEMCGVKMNEIAHTLTKDWTFTPPMKTVTGAGRTIDTEGMSYTATCSECGELDLSGSLTIDPVATPETDEDGKVTVTAYYGEGAVGTFEVTIAKYEIFSNWNGWDIPNGSHTAGFFLNKDKAASIADDMGYELGKWSASAVCAKDFTVGATIYFYFLSEASGTAELSARVQTFANTKMNKAFEVSVFHLDSETQPLTEAEKETMSIGDNVTIGDRTAWGEGWEDFSKSYSVGDVSVTEGWNVIAVKCLSVSGTAYNFNSLILNFR